MHQLRAIQIALESTENRLEEPLRLELLARRAGMSRWYFQRTFSAMVGESVARYIRRRRLTEAARCLCATRATILETALRFQFESHEAFTRAFKAEMNALPSAWRAAPGRLPGGLARVRISPQSIQARYSSMHLTPEIVTLASRTFVGLQAPFIVSRAPRANNLKVIPKLWETFVPRIRETQPLEPTVAYGLCERPASLDRASDPDTALYLAAVECAADAPAPKGMVKWTAPAGPHARFLHRGRIATIGETMGYIYGRWLPASGHERGRGPDIERMDERFDPRSDTSVLEIYIPLRRQK